MSTDDSRPGQTPAPDKTAPHQGTDGGDLIRAAIDQLRGVPQASGSPSGSPALARQKDDLRRWAERLGILLDLDRTRAKFGRGGQEHDVYNEGDRVFKFTKNGVFGLSPGIELALVSSSDDGRQFHLWEATPLEYLERLDLQNGLVPGLNTLEGVLHQPATDDIAIVTSQPRFDIVPVTEPEIDDWFARLGFRKVTTSGYYRAADNLAVFDAHTKNLVRFEDDLIPFDVIPCRPAGGFLEFIEQTLAAGHTLKAQRRTTNS